MGKVWQMKGRNLGLEVGEGFMVEEG